MCQFIIFLLLRSTLRFVFRYFERHVITSVLAVWLAAAVEIYTDTHMICLFDQYFFSAAFLSECYDNRANRPQKVTHEISEKKWEHEKRKKNNMKPSIKYQNSHENVAKLQHCCLSNCNCAFTWHQKNGIDLSSSFNSLSISCCWDGTVSHFSLLTVSIGQTTTRQPKYDAIKWYENNIMRCDLHKYAVCVSIEIHRRSLSSKYTLYVMTVWLMVSH